MNIKVLFSNAGRSLKLMSVFTEGTYRRDKPDYNLTAPIGMTLHFQRNNQKVSAN